MNSTAKGIIAVVLTTIWVSVSEFVRNQFLLHDYWVNHYKSLGLTFPEQPLNGAMWGIWSMFFSIVIYILTRKFSLVQSAALAWFIGFVLMWIVIGNLGVLPFGMLYIAVPLSILEAVVATLIIKKIS